MNNPPGWYKDPYSDAERFWDGSGWTSETRIGSEETSKAKFNPKLILLFAGALAIIFLLVVFVKGRISPASQVPTNNFIINPDKAPADKITVSTEDSTSISESLDSSASPEAKPTPTKTPLTPSPTIKINSSPTPVKPTVKPTIKPKVTKGPSTTKPILVNTPSKLSAINTPGQLSIAFNYPKSNTTSKVKYVRISVSVAGKTVKSVRLTKGIYLLSGEYAGCSVRATTFSTTGVSKSVTVKCKSTSVLP